MKWELLPEHREEYIKKLHRPSNKMVGSGAGGPSSQPSSPQSPPKVFQPQPVRPIASLEDAPDMGNKRLPTGSPPRSITPPPLHSAYRVQPQEAYTPDRGSRLPALRSADKTLVDTPRPPNRGNPGLQVTMASALNTGTAPSPSQPSPFGDDDNNPAIMSAVTPAPQRQHPRLAPPSIGQLPSSYLPTSSPAPFWKYVQFESTPAKLGGDFSPMKDLHSSSPPRPGSSGRVSIRELGSPLKNRSGGFHLGGARNLPPLPVQREVVNLVDDDEDDGGLGDFPGIDLTR